MAKTTDILACDVGSSRIAMGRVCDEQASGVRRVGAADASALAEAMAALWGDGPSPARIVASSVHPGNLAALEAAAGTLGQEILLVGRDLPLPISTDLPAPEKIGVDRLCEAAMAYFRLERACVVADFGTAVTIDCVSDDGVFLGGAILPGLAMGAAALASGTASLPRVELARPDWVFGRDTREAIVGGLVFGARGAMRELTEAYATQLGQWPPVIVTGGDGELVAAGCDFVHAVVPDLCLLGVALAYRVAKADRK